MFYTMETKTNNYQINLIIKRFHDTINIILLYNYILSYRLYPEDINDNDVLLSSYKMLHYPPIVGWFPATSACPPQHVTKGGDHSYVIVLDQITLST